MSNIAILIRKIGVPASRVRPKAEELYRLSRVKRPVMGKMEVARAALCVDCACRVCDESPRDADILRKFSGVAPNMYNALLGQFQTFLAIRTKATHSIRSLAIQFGMSSMVEFVEKTLETFERRFLESLAENRRKHANFDSPAFKAAAFFLCAQKRKRALDKRRLLQLAAVDDEVFKSTCNAMLLHCFDTVGIGSKSDARDVKDHRQLIDNCKFIETAGDRKNRGDDDAEYEQWKQRVMKKRAEAKRAELEKVKQKKRKCIGDSRLEGKRGAENAGMGKKKKPKTGRSGVLLLQNDENVPNKGARRFGAFVPSGSTGPKRKLNTGAKKRKAGKSAPLGKAKKSPKVETAKKKQQSIDYFADFLLGQ